MSGDNSVILLWPTEKTGLAFGKGSSVANRIRPTAFIVCLAVLCFAGCAGSRLSIGQRTIRVVTLNIHHGEKADGPIDLEKIADFINESHPDIVALQDVDRWVPRSGKQDMISRLSDLTGMTYAFASNRDLDGGESGNGILTRFPILEEKSREPVPGRGSKIMELVLDVQGTEMLLLNTAVESASSDSQQAAWTNEIIAAAREHPFVPAIVCVNFELEPTESTMTALSAGFQDTWTGASGVNRRTETVSSHRPRLDYIFLSVGRAPADSKTPQTGLKTVAVETIPVSASGRGALKVDLQIVSE